MDPFSSSPNAITIDVEDWVQSVFDPDATLTESFRSNTERVLAVLEKHQTKATFFVLGLAAEKAPDLVRRIVESGHEVQSHGYGHRLIHTQSVDEFRTDVDRSKKLLEDLTGGRITGYRAPRFSITSQTSWALDVLADVGFEYDSSVFPLCVRGYGIAGIPRYPHRIRLNGRCDLVEVPVATYSCAGVRVPTGGGGYFRLLPYTVLRRGLKQLNQAGHPAVIYMHPYEFNPGELRNIDASVSWKMRLHQGLGRQGFPAKVERLLRSFRFRTISDILRSLPEPPVFDYESNVAPASA